MADDAERRAFLAAHVAADLDTALVSPEMPLRANLAVLENIALIPQYRQNMAFDQAADLAWSLIVVAGLQDAANKRDPDLSHEQRFVAKLLRAAVSRPSIILIERPGMLLPDTCYPPYLAALIDKLSAHLNTCWIVDYAWNKPLYPNP